MSPQAEVAQYYLDKYFSGYAEFENPEDPLRMSHLKWMLGQICLEYMTETKSNRWLGFVQGVLASSGTLDVQLERKRTRPIFNGR
ncbi:hypothetical protein [Vibrio phage vB_VpaP_SJSY21]|nr:hypothetical protein [Vibrio phage vB_VpaP_SJSY21]